jgi:Fe-S-cluster-containing dehydrogenase component/formate-dependent nitrite reductase membrane component NrfD
VRFGFVIDQDRCIGCHACTVACKEEHNVPVGVFRTWVKYIEKGEFPNASRHFGVMRCNHCDDAPCVEICPTVALFRRDDGIVDFDSSRCIGCKSCMQACPYDALYIDPNSHTAAKCNYCAHRADVGLAPACVIVCPTQAIIAGDLDDSAAPISRILATRKVISRKPEKGTNPKLFYVGIDGDLINPAAAAQEATQLWAERQPADAPAELPAGYQRFEPPGSPRVVYNAAHPAPWGWMIGAYLFTKSIAAGALMVAALMALLGYRAEGAVFDLAAPLIAIAFAGLTGVLLIADLKRPDRFYFLFTRANPRSFVVIGAWILLGYGGLAALWFLSAIVASAPAPPPVVGAAAVLSIGAACYTGFLFAQARGRDLWQSPLFTWHLLIQAIIAGAAVLELAAIRAHAGLPTLHALGATMIAGMGLSGAMILGEVFLPPASEDVGRATAILTRGTLSAQFWGGALGAGIAAPIVLAVASGGAGALMVLAAILALGGIWIFESLWVRAGQAVPLS